MSWSNFGSDKFLFELSVHFKKANYIMKPHSSRPQRTINMELIKCVKIKRNESDVRKTVLEIIPLFHIGFVLTNNSSQNLKTGYPVSK